MITKNLKVGDYVWHTKEKQLYKVVDCQDVINFSSRVIPQTIYKAVTQNNKTVDSEIYFLINDEIITDNILFHMWKTYAKQIRI